MAMLGVQIASEIMMYAALKHFVSYRMAAVRPSQFAPDVHQYVNVICGEGMTSTCNQSSQRPKSANSREINSIGS